MATNETKHTPGPWRACVWDPMERPHVHADVPGERVCTAKRDLPLTAADARLIAAAPDLLEALKQILPFLEEDFPADERAVPTTWAYGQAVLAIRAAIAKATR